MPGTWASIFTEAQSALRSCRYFTPTILFISMILRYLLSFRADVGASQRVETRLSSFFTAKQKLETRVSTWVKVRLGVGRDGGGRGRFGCLMISKLLRKGDAKYLFAREIFPRKNQYSPQSYIEIPFPPDPFHGLSIPFM
jgi:hypothetical protein